MARTDPGLGPKSSPEESGARPAPKDEPKKFDSVEAVLAGFGAHRPDRPRVRPTPDFTPVPEIAKPKVEQGSTTRGRRQRENRQLAFHAVVIFVCIGVAVYVGLKLVQPPPSERPVSTTNAMTLAPPLTTTPPPALTTTVTPAPPTPPPIDTSMPVTPPPVVTTTGKGFKPLATAQTSAASPGTTAPSAASKSPTAPATTAAPSPETTMPEPDPKYNVKRTL